MRHLFVFASLTLGSSLAFATSVVKPVKPPEATLTLESKSGSTVKGTGSFSVDGKKITFKLDVQGATEGVHAVHIHETGDCSAPDAKSAGGHWNPNTDAHGKWGEAHHHLGDIGNLTVDKKGNGTLTLTTDKWSIVTGAANNPIGRAIIVHEKVDDFATQPTGNAGGRVACGKIEATK